MAIVYKLFANCIPVKGYSRSAIYDLQRNKYQFIPNSLFEILKKFDGQTIKNVKQAYDNEYDEIIDEYYNFLTENEFVFETSEPSLFSPINLEWSNPSTITNSIICFDKIAYNIKPIVKQLNDLGCKALQLRFFKIQKKNEYEKTLNFFIDTKIQDIEIIMPFNSEFIIEDFKELFNNNQRLSKVLIFNAPEDKQEFIDEHKTLLVLYSQLSIKDNNFCGNIYHNNFTKNITFFTESQKHNTCLNRKISIDVNGDIKNCPSMKKSYGNIKNTTLKEAIEKPGFKDLWYINKDKIDVCKDCEFRYMCTDCRAFIKDPNNIYSQPAKCNYNPYIAKWKGQDGYITVEEWRKQNSDWEEKAKKSRMNYPKIKL